MNWIIALALIRILGYGYMAFYALRQRRWLVWATFTALVATTYVYAFTGIPPVAVELARTIVACGLICITLKRR